MESPCHRGTELRLIKPGILSCQSCKNGYNENGLSFPDLEDAADPGSVVGTVEIEKGKEQRRGKKGVDQDDTIW